jgi:antagonist of KipI
MSIVVEQPGLLTTLQDRGRYGYQKHGLSISGAMDSLSLRIANLLVNNDENEAVLEITIKGPKLHFETETIIALCGANLGATINNQPLPMYRPVFIPAHSTLSFGTPQSGCRAYLAVAGGFDIPEILGSQSTDLQAKIGRPLQKGDKLPLRAKVKLPELPYHGHAHPLDFQRSTVRIIRGNEWEQFTKESRHAILSTPYQILPQSNRMGYQLQGTKLSRVTKQELISTAVTKGTIQVPPSGDPILLMSEAQTLGGYPRIGHVIQADLPLVAQSPPGSYIRFQLISVQQAQQLYKRQEHAIRQLKVGLRSIRGGTINAN